MAATNWFWEAEYQREVGVTGSGVQPVMLGILFCEGGIWYLGRRAYGLVRETLDARTRLEKTVKLISFKPVLPLLPLLAHYHNSGVERLIDGNTVHRSYGYGTDAGWVLFLLGTALIILFQIVARFESAKVTDDAAIAPVGTV